MITSFDPTKSFSLILKLSDNQHGYVFFGELGIEKDVDMSKLNVLFEPGTLLQTVFIKNIKEDAEKGTRIECSLSKPTKSDPKYEVGAKVLCRYVNFRPGFGATVQISLKQYGFIDLCEINDDIVPNVDEILKEKAIFFARVIDVYKSKPQLSSRQTILDDDKYSTLVNDCTSLEFKEKFGADKEKGDLRNFIMKYHNWRQLITENMLVRGYVTTINQHGVFIKLARNFTARASINEINDNGPSATADSFLALNTTVLARITSFFKDKVNVSIRDSILLYGIDEVDISEVQPGVKAKLLVLTVADNLAYCQIIGSAYKCRVQLQKSDPKVKPDQKIIARVKNVSTNGPVPSVHMHEVEECDDEYNDEYYRISGMIDQVKLAQAEDFKRSQEAEENETEQVSIENTTQNTNLPFYRTSLNKISESCWRMIVVVKMMRQMKKLKR